METFLPVEEQRRLHERTEEQRNEDVSRLMGTCREACNEALERDPTLTLKRGHYMCPFWGPRGHWWLVRPDGVIVDPTAGQFLSNGAGAYIEFNGMIECELCGKEVAEDNAYLVEHHAYCSSECYARDVL